MQTIALIGEYSPYVPSKMKEILPQDFSIIRITSYEEFSKLENVDYIILRSLKLNEQAINSLKQVKMIHRWGSGHDSVDIQAAGKRGIPVLVALGVNAVAVAEHCILLMLSIYRQIITIKNMFDNGAWNRQVLIEKSFLLKGKTLGLIGCGNVGKLVAEKARAFDVQTIYHDVRRLPPDVEEALGLRYVSLEELYSTSDIISIHVPAIEGTIGMIGRKQFGMMKPSAIIINTARGSVINEPELIEALQNKQIFGAGLDSFAVEPLPPDSPLLFLDNVVLTPHIGGNTRDLNNEMVRCVIGNIVKKHNNEELPKGMFVNSQYIQG